jgi:hypothetical protein
VSAVKEANDPSNVTWLLFVDDHFGGDAFLFEMSVTNRHRVAWIHVKNRTYQKPITESFRKPRAALRENDFVYVP